jgi:hypothetical protein
MVHAIHLRKQRLKNVFFHSFLFFVTSEFKFIILVGSVVGMQQQQQQL